MTSRPIRVLLVEDNRVFREALELLLKLQPDLDVVASVEDGTEAVGACLAASADVAIVDYRLPGLDGVQVTGALRAARPETAVVCLSAEASRREVAALHAAGAVACLTKDQALTEIVDAVRAAAAIAR